MTRDATAEALSRQSIAAANLLAELRTDDAELAHDMIEGETSLFEALAAAIDEIDQCEIIADGCKAKVEEIGKRRHRADARASRIRALIEQAMAMADLSSVRLPLATLSLKATPPKVVVNDESLIPSEFWAPQSPVLDKKALNDAAKLREIPGVGKTNGGVSLQIRRA
ncbi:siphovirus Gp157 family protein [uncultured Zoogloea sp.]|uniref:siphovirus Gp157 family protein n=1 Tax=uncultured Zoogloea sp. TaxID=160237 RepID=UPI002607AE9F|nr:siphovirus Gp157 family protein [uncultured Zoogloea sp.]